MNKILLISLIFLTTATYAKEHQCAINASERAKELYIFHNDLDEGMKNATTISYSKPYLIHSKYHKKNRLLLLKFQIFAEYAKGAHEINLTYIFLENECSLVGESINEDWSRI